MWKDRDGTDYQTCHGEIIAETDLAILIDINPEYHGELQEQEIWIPRSQCPDGESLEIGDRDPDVADWLLEKKGLL